MVVAVQVVGHRMYLHGQSSTQVAMGPHIEYQVDPLQDFDLDLAAPQHRSMSQAVVFAKGTAQWDRKPFLKGRARALD